MVKTILKKKTKNTQSTPEKCIGKKKQDFGIGQWVDRCWARRKNLITKYKEAGKTFCEATDLADELMFGAEFVASKKHERDSKELKFQQNLKAEEERRIKANQKNEDYKFAWSLSRKHC